MEILIIVFINVLFLVVVYATLSRKIKRIESRSLPEQLENEMNSIITNFNGTAAGNIDLLDDRLRRLEPLAARAEKLNTELEGQLKRAEALGKLRELAQQPRPPAAEEPRTPPEQPQQSVALAYRETQQEAARLQEKKNLAKAESAQAQEKKSAAKSAPKKKAVKKQSRARKTPEEILREMTEAGDDTGEIARVLGIPREEVAFKQRLLGMRDNAKIQGNKE